MVIPKQGCRTALDTENVWCLCFIRPVVLEFQHSVLCPRCWYFYVPDYLSEIRPLTQALEH